MLIAVAIANASQVWPEGNEGLPPAEIFSIIGWVMKGLGLLKVYFNILETMADEITTEKR